jgi:hypothetical protein
LKKKKKAGLAPLLHLVYTVAFFMEKKFIISLELL